MKLAEFLDQNQHLDQKRYVTNILERFGMSDCKERCTPSEQKPKPECDSEHVNPR